MPVLERDPWRMQYFEGVPCPDGVAIPTDDGDSYELFPKYRWVYNKLLICETQGMEHAPHGLPPNHYPVFSKPIYNMRGMGAGSKIVRSREEYEREQAPGHMWMALLEGEHVSSDAAVIDGEPVWWRHSTGRPLDGGMFDYWIVHAEARPGIESYCGDWLRRNLRGYSGMVNFETIGGTIIETHLRFSDQWPDLYGGRPWVESVIELYSHGIWPFEDRDRRTGYSVVLFGAHGLRYRKVEQVIIAELLQRPSITSIQMTFHEDKPPKAHSMPPGGFRLAIANCWDLEAGFAVREQLALSFWSTQKLGKRRRRKVA